MAIIKNSKGAMSSMDANKWLAIVGLISALALGIGLVTSLISIGLGWRINNEQKVEIAASNKEAKDAGERAANALRDAGIANEAAGKANASAAQVNERAQKLENDNIQLRTDLETATAEARAKQAELAKEQSSLADAQRKTAEAQRKAAEAQLALKTHVEAVARWQQDRKLTAPLPNRREIDPAGIWLVSIAYKQGDDEAFRFAGRIFDALMAAGWSVSNDPHPIPVGQTSFELGAPSVRPGVTLSAPSSEVWQSRARALAKAFEQSGCPVNWAPAVPPRQPLLIIVGSKPAFSN